MKWKDEDRRFILASVEDLDQYLASTQLNWRLDKSATTLTLGSLLLSIKRVSGVEDKHAIVELQDVILCIEEIKRKRTSTWEGKIKAESQSRLRLWKNTLSDYVEDGKIDQAYSAQVKNRVILDLLSTERKYTDPAIDHQIDELDSQLRKLTKVGPFVWDIELENIFEPEKFWYLYVQMS